MPYVDPSLGVDGVGTQLDPYNTYVGKPWSASVKYYQKGGTTYAGPVSIGANGTSSDHVVLGNYGSGYATITGGAGVSGYAVMCFSLNYVDFTGIIVDSSGALGGVHLGQSTNITFTDFISRNNIKGIYDGLTEIVLDRVQVYGCTSNGVERFAQNNNNNNGYRIRNSIIRNNSPHGIRFQAGDITPAETGRFSNIEITGCTITNNAQYGFFTSSVNSAGGADHHFHNIVFENNIVANNGYSSAALQFVDTALSVRRNTVYSNGATKVATTPGGLHVLGCSVGVVEDNVVYSNPTGAALSDGCGIMIDTGCNNIAVRRNYCHSHAGDTAANSGQGIAVFAATNIEVSANICVGNKQNIWISNGATTGVTVSNNTTVGGSSNNVLIESNVPTSAVTLRNNISANPTAYHIQIASLNAQTHNYNCYYPDGAALFRRNGVNYNLAGWQTATSQDANSITSDPLLDSNYRLLPGSPCRGAGVFVSDVKDYFGNNFRTPPSMGAIEYNPAFGINSARSFVARTSDSTRVSYSKRNIRG